MAQTLQDWLQQYPQFREAFTYAPPGLDVERLLNGIVDAQAWPLPVPSMRMLSQTPQYNLACAVVSLAQKRKQLPVGHPWHMANGSCCHWPYQLPVRLPCPVTTHTLPQPYCRKLPDGYSGIILDVALAARLGIVRTELSAWTHGMFARLCDYRDVSAVRAAITGLIGDYPVDVAIDGGDVVLRWMDPDAPGAVTHEWLRSVNAT